MSKTASCLKPLFVAAALFSSAAVLAQGTYRANETYANPDPETTNFNRNRPCSDPWVTIALVRVYGVADPSRCGVGLYNGGQWRDFNELVHAVERTRVTMQQQNVSTRLVPITGAGFQGKSIIGIYQGPQLVAAGGGNMVAAGGGNIVAAGGGNVIINNGGNITVSRPGNFVGNAGGNVLTPMKISGASAYSVKSGQSFSLPKGALVPE